MCDPSLWALMQRVERLRYRAELLERASVDQPPAIQQFLLELAGQSRRMADCTACGQGEPAEQTDSCGACAYREWALAPAPASSEEDLEAAA